MPRETKTRKNDSGKSERNFNVSRRQRRKQWPSLWASRCPRKHLKTPTWFL